MSIINSKVDQQNAPISFLNDYVIPQHKVPTRFDLRNDHHQGTRIKQYFIKHSQLLYTHSPCSAQCRVIKCRQFLQRSKMESCYTVSTKQLTHLTEGNMVHCVQCLPPLSAWAALKLGGIVFTERKINLRSRIERNILLNLRAVKRNKLKWNKKNCTAFHVAHWIQQAHK